MSYNTFGHVFRMTTFGESHGIGIGCVIDGCPPNISLDEGDIQPFLDSRRPGSGRYVSQRKESDRVRILSGCCEDSSGLRVTSGAPLCLYIENEDSRSKDYDAIKDRYRPGHADFTYDMKYGVRDYRGGGRSSARETAVRVAAGAVARKVLPWVSCRGALVQMGTHEICRENWDWDEVSRNPFFCPDKEAVDRWGDYLDGVRKSGSSCGAVVEVIVSGVPSGLGAPLYAKLDQDLASAMMSINAVKGVEIGAGFSSAGLRGEENADEMRFRDGRVEFLSNHAGGILGGISTGADIVVRFAVKPTSSILLPRRTITSSGEETDIVTKGRHDPCVGIRAVPVGEAMAALVIADHSLLHRAQTGFWGTERKLKSI